MVDAVLYFEGERQNAFRIIRAVKNRYGSTGEIGVFEMTDKGLAEVPNPSKMLLSGRPKGVSGNCAVCVMEGSRPLIAEIQALSVPTVFPPPAAPPTALTTTVHASSLRFLNEDWVCAFHKTMCI
jgi:DNA repair protein RadA/Sms